MVLEESVNEELSSDVGVKMPLVPFSKGSIDLTGGVAA